MFEGGLSRYLSQGLQKFQSKLRQILSYCHQKITFFIFAVSLLVIFQLYYSVVPGFEARHPLKLDLSGKWELCLPSDPDEKCKWALVEVPRELSSEFLPNLHGWMIYRRQFTAPKDCLEQDSSCSVFFGEIGDVVEAKLNGIAIGRRGEFPPYGFYSKHYPIRFDLSRDLLKFGENELELKIFALKKVQAGIRSGPVGIYASINGFKVTQNFVAYSAEGVLRAGLSQSAKKDFTKSLHYLDSLIESFPDKKEYQDLRDFLRRLLMTGYKGDILVDYGNI